MDEEVVPILHVASAATLVAWYERLGFSKGGSTASIPTAPRSCRSRVAVRGCSCPNIAATLGPTPWSG